MDESGLQDRIYRGLGVAARSIGLSCDAYRAASAASPLASVNRFLRLAAAFNPKDNRFAKAGEPNEPVWYGVFDGAYIEAGDYLVETRPSGRIWFVGTPEALLPSLVVLTNTVVSVTRPGLALRPGANSYGGGDPAIPVMTSFPASLLHSGGGRGQVTIPADARQGGAVALLPAVSSVSILRGDMLHDNTGRSFVVGLAERNTLGWRLELRQAAS